MELKIDTTLESVSQVDGIDAEMGIQFSIAPFIGEIIIAEGKQAFIQVDFKLNGLIPTSISQELIGEGTLGTVINSNNPFILMGTYYPGEIVTQTSLTNIIQYPTAKLYITQ